MRYLRTKLGTDFRQPRSWWERLVHSIDTANPNYRGKYHMVRTWLIEFDDSGKPWREIRLDESGSVVLAGPSENDYGFWLDTNMRLADFNGEPISMEYFEKLWADSGVLAP